MGCNSLWASARVLRRTESGTADASIAISKYGVKGIPAQFVIDKTGKVTFASTGYQKGDHALEDALSRLTITIKYVSRSKE